MSYLYLDKKTGKLWHYAGYGKPFTPLGAGTEPVPIAWKASIQYDRDVSWANQILDDITWFVPGLMKVEIVGFFF